MNFFPFIHKIKKKKEKELIQLPLYIEKPMPEEKPKDEEKETKIELELF